MSEESKPSGAGMRWPSGSFAELKDLASFRALVAYNPYTDEFALRLDVKVGRLQHNEVLLAALSEVRAGGTVYADSPLINPGKGVTEVTCVRADRLELASKLRLLAGKLEEMK